MVWNLVQLGTKACAEQSNILNVVKLWAYHHLGGDTERVEPACFHQLLGDIPVGFSTVMDQANTRVEL